jgi:hypothetical protein
MVQVFISHSKYDKEFCDRFDSACARVGLKSFRSEFEDIEKPAWKTINKEIKKSNALFLLVGKEFVIRQTPTVLKPHENNWVFTQNWISYEIGVASHRGIDVWVVCDSIPINFPVPYLNNYELFGINLEVPENRKFWYSNLDWYKVGRKSPLDKRVRYSCPKCRATYNLLDRLAKGSQIVCPTCLNILDFPEGWLLEWEDMSFVKRLFSKVLSKEK